MPAAVSALGTYGDVSMLLFGVSILVLTSLSFWVSANLTTIGDEQPCKENEGDGAEIYYRSFVFRDELKTGAPGMVPKHQLSSDSPWHV